MGLMALLSRKLSSFSVVRRLTTSEQESLASDNAELAKEIDRVMANHETRAMRKAKALVEA